MANWSEMLKAEVYKRGDIFENLVCTISEEELSREFYDSYGTSEGAPFTAWGENWVYFPVVYDGAEWVESVPRNPCDVSTDHIGGQ